MTAEEIRRQKATEAHRRWVERNKKHVAAYQKAYKEAHREELREYKRKWAHKKYHSMEER